MTTTALPAPTRPGLGRLTLVELRKMTDTRAGFWLLATTVALTALITVVACIVLGPDDRPLRDLLAVAVQPASILAPILGILLVTSEWSQRTAMITFALVPRRGRVLVAKLAAGTFLAALAFVLCLLAAVVATAIAGGDGAATWSLSAAMLAQVAFSVLVPMLAGIAFGAVLLASAPAIVLYFVAPIAWAALGSIPALEGAAGWLDQARTLSPLLEEPLSAGEWGRVATSLALWLAAPLALGAWRVARSDVR